MIPSLTPAGNNIYVGGGALFDFSDVTSASPTKQAANPLQLQMIKAVELLIARANLLGGAPLVLLQGAASRENRVIKFFTNQRSFILNTASQEQNLAEIGGMAHWRSTKDGLENRPTTPVADRVDLRVFVNSSTDKFLHEVVPTVWHEMTHTLTNLSHGEWSHGGGFVNPGSAENQSWNTFIGQLRAAAPDSESDPADTETDFIKNGTVWSCACGLVHAT